MYLVFCNLIRSNSTSDIHRTNAPNKTKESPIMLVGMFGAGVRALELLVCLPMQHAILTLMVFGKDN